MCEYMYIYIKLIGFLNDLINIFTYNKIKNTFIYIYKKILINNIIINNNDPFLFYLL